MTVNPTIYQTYAGKYVDAGYRVMPLHGKAPYEKLWWKKSCARDTREKADAHAFQHPAQNIGLAMGVKYNVGGQPYLLIGIDFDYVGYLEKEKDGLTQEQLCEAEAHAVEATQEAYRRLPDTKLLKVGRKGFTGLYLVPADEFAGTTRVGGVLDVLGVGTQTVLPPSIHPETDKPYLWLEDHLQTRQDMPGYGPEDAAVLPIAKLMDFVRYCHELRAGLQRVELSDDELDEALRKTMAGEAAQRFRAGPALVNNQARMQLWRWIEEAIRDWPNFKIENFEKVDGELRPDKWVVTNMLRESGQGQVDQNRKANLQPRMNWKSDPTGRFASLRDHAEGGTTYSAVAFIMGVLEFRRSGDRAKVREVLTRKPRHLVDEAEQWLTERIDLQPQLSEHVPSAYTEVWREQEIRPLEIAQSGMTAIFNHDVAKVAAHSQRVNKYADRDTSLDIIAARRRNGNLFDQIESEAKFIKYPDCPEKRKQADLDLELLSLHKHKQLCGPYSKYAPISTLAITTGVGKTWGSVGKIIEMALPSLTRDFLYKHEPHQISDVFHFAMPNNKLKDEQLSEAKERWGHHVKSWLTSNRFCALFLSIAGHRPEADELRELEAWLSADRRVGAYHGIEPLCRQTLEKHKDPTSKEWINLSGDSERMEDQWGKATIDEVIEMRSRSRRAGYPARSFCNGCPAQHHCSYWNQNLSQTALVMMSHATLTTQLPAHIFPDGMKRPTVTYIDEDPTRQFNDIVEIAPRDLIGARTLSHCSLNGSFCRTPRPAVLLQMILSDSDWRSEVAPNALRGDIRDLQHLQRSTLADRAVKASAVQTQAWQDLRAGKTLQAEPEAVDAGYRPVSLTPLRLTIHFLLAVLRVLDADNLSEAEQRTLPWGCFDLLIKPRESESGRLAMGIYKFRDNIGDWDTAQKEHELLHDEMDRVRLALGQDIPAVRPQLSRARHGTPIALLDATANKLAPHHAFGRQPDYHPDLVQTTQVRVALDSRVQIYGDTSGRQHSRSSLTTNASAPEYQANLLLHIWDVSRQGRVRVLVCAPMIMLERLTPLPPGTIFLTSGKVTGSNFYRDFDAVFIITNNEPDCDTIQRTAEVFKCGKLTDYKHGHVRREVIPDGLALENGNFGGITRREDGRLERIKASADHRFKDPDAEAVRDRVCDAWAEQAAGRLRGANRRDDSSSTIRIYRYTISLLREPDTHSFNSIEYGKCITPERAMEICGITPIDQEARGVGNLASFIAPKKWKDAKSVRNARSYRQQGGVLLNDSWHQDIVGRKPSPRASFNAPSSSGPVIIFEDRLTTTVYVPGCRYGIKVRFANERVREFWLANGITTNEQSSAKVKQAVTYCEADIARVQTACDQFIDEGIRRVGTDQVRKRIAVISSVKCKRAVVTAIISQLYEATSYNPVRYSLHKPKLAQDAGSGE